MRKGQTSVRRQHGKRLPWVELEGLEGRSLFSATLNPVADIASPSPTDGQQFGITVATKGSLALVGSTTGVVTLYDTSTNTALGSYVDPNDPDGSQYYGFGSSLTFFGSGDSFAIGAPADGGGGKVFVYASPSSSPVVLTAENYIGYDVNTWQYAPSFGGSLAGYGDNLLVGTTTDQNVNNDGTVQLINAIGTGQVIQTFNNPESSSFYVDQFGSHIAVSGNQILFSAQDNVEDPTNGGAEGPSVLYLYDGSNFLNDQGQLRRFEDPTHNSNFRFGSTIAFDGDAIAVGVSGVQVTFDDSGVSTVGSPVYQFSASTGELTHTYDQPASVPYYGNQAYTGWGAGVAISGNHLLISAPNALNETMDNYAGQVYAYDLGTGEQLASAVAPEEGSQFGLVLAGLPNNQFLVADPSSSSVGDYAGIVHVYELDGADGTGQGDTPPVADAGADQSAVAGDTVNFSGAGSTADAGATIVSYSWDFDYDGTNFNADYTSTDPTSSYVYTASGTYTVALQVTDDHGHTGLDTAVVTVAEPPPPPVTMVGSTVQVAGLNTANTVSFATDGSGQLLVTLNGTNYGPFASASKIVVNLGDGNDLVTGNKAIPINMEVFAGAGNDTITGAGGDDILVGGGGNDVITAGAGRDIIIGSAGSDSLNGKAGQDIVIAGSTSFDTDAASLEAIQAEWTSGHNIDNRVANLTDGAGTKNRMNGSVFLQSGVTVFDDSAVDTLNGGGGKDWLIFNATGSGVLDVFNDVKGANIITDV